MPPLPRLASPEARIEVVKALANFFDETRRRGSATSYLTQFGFKNASVYLDYGGRMSRWVVPEAKIKLSHAGASSTISGNISIETASEPWNLEFQAQQDTKRDRIALVASVSDFTPASIAPDFPGIPQLKIVSLPVKMATRATMLRDGTIASAELDVDLGAGELHAPWDDKLKHPAAIDRGAMRFSYTEASSKILLKSSVLAWGPNRIELTGEAAKEKTGAGAHRWEFNFFSPKLILGVEEFNLPSIQMDTLAIAGNYDPQASVINLHRFQIQALDASINLSGRAGIGQNSSGVQMKGVISSMPVAFMKLIWPKFVAGGAREWTGNNMTAGHISGGSIAMTLTPAMMEALATDGDVPNEAVSVQIDLNNLVLNHIKGLPPIRTGKARAIVAGKRFVFDVPEESRILLPSGAQVLLNSGQFIVGDVRPDVPYGELHFKGSGTAAAVGELLDSEPLAYLKTVGFKREGISGAASGSFSIGIPLKKEVEFKQLSLRGKARVDDIKAEKIYERMDVQGGTVTFDITEKALDAQGDLKVNNVPVQLAWQRIFDAPPEHQPRLRLRSVLNEKARDEFGLPVNHFLRGNVVANLAVGAGTEGVPAVAAEIDLTAADLFLTNIGWRKPPGQRAIMSFDVQRQNNGHTLLKDVRMLGDDLSIAGSITLNEQHRLAAFEFPTFSFNILTKLEITGALSSQNIWKVDAKGTSYDGRQFFRSLFSAGQLAENQPVPSKDEPGMDIHAEIGTVIGFFDTTVKTVTIDTRKRAGKMSGLEVTGRLNGTAPVAVRLDVKPGKPRYLLAEATDAGAAFRVVGFYPAMRGGEASLKVDLDGEGLVERSGILYAENFVVVGDQVVEKVAAQGPVATRQPGTRQSPAHQTVSEDQKPFDRLIIPFAVGHGQFVLKKSGIKGPMEGATISGHIDFERDIVDLQGTYVPLYGLNSVVGVVPLLGDILAPNGEGLFGIKFSVKGPASQPDVMVNPASLLTPGFLAGIWDADQEPPRIIPRASASDSKRPVRR